MLKPLNVNVGSEEAEKVAAAADVTFRANITLSRVGTFTLRLTFTDEMTGKQVSMEAPLKVVAR